MCIMSLLGGLDHSDDWIKNICFVCFHYVPTHHHFVDYKMCLLDVKHYIQLTDIFEVLVQSLDHIVDEL